MFCEKCGKSLEGAERFCPECGAPVPFRETEKAAAVTTGQEEASAGNGTPGDRPSGKKKKAVFLIAGGAAILAAAILCIVNSAGIGNFFRRSFSSPEEYYRHVEEAAVSELAGAWSKYYEILAGDSMVREESSTGVEFTVELGEGAKDLMGLLGAAGVDLTWLEELSVDMGYSLKDSVASYALSLGLNREDLLSANMVLDAEKGGLYLQLPELTADYIGFDLAELTGQNWLESLETYREMQESRRQMLNALPDAGELEKLQQKYLRLLLNSISEVERARKTLKAGGVSQKCTELEVTVDGKTLAEMLEAMLEEMREDEYLKELIVHTMDNLIAAGGITYLDEYSDYGWSGEDYYNDLMEELAGAQDSLEELKDLGDVLVMKVYVDGRGRIAGRVLELLEDGEVLGEISVLSPKKGSRNGYEISVNRGYGEEIALTGSGKTSGNKLTGDFGLEYGGITILDMKVTGLDLKQWEQGYFNGRITVTPSKAISSLLSASLSYYDTVYASMLPNMQLTLDSQMSKKGGKIKLGLNWDKEDLVKLIVSVKKGSGPETEVPAAENTVFMKEEEDLAAWLSGMDWEGFIGKLEKSDLPEEVVDVIREGAALFSEEGIGMLLNPYYPYDFWDPDDNDDPDRWSDDYDGLYDDPGKNSDGDEEDSGSDDGGLWGAEKSLESVLQSEDWRNEISGWNEQISDLGITLDAVADGNTLVFAWYLPDNDTFNETVCGVMADSFLDALESADFLTAFREGYGVSLDGVRCTFYNADGSEIYRDEIN